MSSTTAQEARPKRRSAADRKAKAQARLEGGNSPAIRPGMQGGQYRPLNDDDLKEFLKLQKKKADSDKSWTVNIADVNEDTWDLSVKNPNADEEVVYRDPSEILDEIEQLDQESAAILEKVRGLL